MYLPTGILLGRKRTIELCCFARPKGDTMMKKMFTMALVAAMLAFAGTPVASADEYLEVDGPVEAGDVLVDQNGDVYVVEEEEEPEEEVLVVDEPVESGDVLVSEDGDVYVVQ